MTYAKGLLPMIYAVNILIIPGCSDIDFDKNRYREAVRDGFTKIPQACQVEELFGEADHFISYSGSRDVRQDWNTEVFFLERYSLTMQVEVKVNREFSRITSVVGEPMFYLTEFESIDGSTAKFGRSHDFTLADWNRVVDADGDLSVIGIAIKKDAPVADFERYVKQYRASRIEVRPDCGKSSKVGTTRPSRDLPGKDK